MLPSAEGIAFAIPADAVAAMLERALGACAPRNPLPGVDRNPRPTPGPAPVVVRPRTAPRTGRSEPVPRQVPLTPSDVGLLIGDDGRRLVVRRVTPGSPAARGGMATGDRLLEVDGYPVESLGDVRLAFSSSHPGRVYELRIDRNREVLELTLMIPQ
jgi:S1-C subfamily serine protease